MQVEGLADKMRGLVVVYIHFSRITWYEMREPHLKKRKVDSVTDDVAVVPTYRPKRGNRLWRGQVADVLRRQINVRDVMGWHRSILPQCIFRDECDGHPLMTIS